MNGGVSNGQNPHNPFSGNGNGTIFWLISGISLAWD